MTPKEQIRELQAMLNSVGWKLFSTAVQEQQDHAVVKLVTNRLECMDQVLAQEFAKGGIARVATIISLPETLIEQLQYEEKENENTE